MNKGKLFMLPVPIADGGTERHTARTHDSNGS